MNDTIDAGGLRREIRGKYREVALQPGRAFDFRTGRPLAEFLGYPRTVIDALPGRAVESFAGVGNPFALPAGKLRDCEQALRKAVFHVEYPAETTGGCLFAWRRTRV